MALVLHASNAIYQLPLCKNGLVMHPPLQQLLTCKLLVLKSAVLPLGCGANNMTRWSALSNFAHRIKQSQHSLTLDHLELLHYISRDPKVPAHDLYERYSAHKQTIRSRLHLLKRLDLITTLSNHNLGGNTYSHEYTATTVGQSIVDSWPFSVSIDSANRSLKKILLQDRESAINVHQLVLLLQIADMKKHCETVSINRMVELSGTESKNTLIKRLQYLRKKGLVVLDTRAITVIGLSATYKCSPFGSSITARFSLKKRA